MDSILRKPGRLTDEESNIVKQHASLGQLIIKEIPNLDEVLAAVGGHPSTATVRATRRGSKGEGMPFLARILAVTDAYPAMTTDRPYRKALAREQAQTELRRVAGTQLDPKRVKAFISLLNDEATCQVPGVASGLSVA